jgi:hypothetical protein
MSTPPEDTRFEEAFADLAHSAELMVDPVDPSVLHGRVRRRRTTRGALAAGLAALLVAAPAAWWLQESNGDVDVPPAERTSEAATPEESTGAETTTLPEGGATGTHSENAEAPVLPSFGDLVGAEIELPPFVPDSESYDSACPVSPAVPADGTPDWDSGQWRRDSGPVWLLKVVHTPLEAGGPTQAVALFGCSPSESMIRQAVVIAGDGDGGWEVTEEVARGNITEFPLWDIAPAATSGVLLMVPGHETTGQYHESETGFEILRHRTGEELVDVTDEAYLWGVTDLSITVEMLENDDGTRTAEVTVANEGDHESQRIQLSLCADENLAADGPYPTDACAGDMNGAAVLDPLEPGDSVTERWTLTVPPLEDWSEGEQAGGLTFSGWIRPLLYSVDGFVFDPDGSNDDAHVTIFAEDME